VPVNCDRCRPTDAAPRSQEHLFRGIFVINVADPKSGVLRHND